MILGILIRDDQYKKTMKKIASLAFLVVLTLPSICFSQIDVGIGYINGNPVGNMGKAIRNAHGIDFKAMYHWPRLRIGAGVELGISGYGYQTREMDILLDNGRTVNADISILNSILQPALVFRYEFLNSSVLNPYLTARTGWSRYTTQLTATDADDTYDDGSPIEYEDARLSSGNSFVFGGGAGVLIDMSFTFPQIQRNTLLIDVSVNYLHGTEVQFMNAKSNLNDIQSTESFEFLLANAEQPRSGHGLHDGYIFKTPLQVAELRVGVLYRFIKPVIRKEIS